MTLTQYVKKNHPDVYKAWDELRKDARRKYKTEWQKKNYEKKYKQ
jgi:hypothetical protein